MYLTSIQTLVMIAVIALGTMLTRFIPFILFPEGKQPPQFVLYLGRVLPPAVMGLLVVYCLKGVSVLKSPYGLPELIAICLIAFLHFWRHNTLLSIAGGTVCYMLLVQFVFV